MQSRECSKTAVGERAVDLRLGSRDCSLELQPIFPLSGAPLLEPAPVRHRIRCLGGCGFGRCRHQPVQQGALI